MSMEAAPTAEPTAIPEAVVSEPAEHVTHADKVDSIIQDVGDKIDRRDNAPEAPAAEAKPLEAVSGPVAWRADMRQRFGTLPPELQAYIMEREHSAHGKISELGKPAAEARALSEVTERYRDALPSDMPVPVMVEHLLAAHKAIEADPLGSLKQLAAGYGIDLAKLAGGEPQEPIDHAAIAEVHIQAIKEARAEARAEALIEQFANGIDSWDELAADIYGQAVALKQSNPNMPERELLKKAHERATQVNERFASQQRAERERQQLKDNSKRAAEAKRVASLNVKTSAAAPVRIKGGWEATLRDVGERIAARG